jgi:hypothetical protein
MNLTKNEINLMRKPPAKFVGRDKRTAEELVHKGMFHQTSKDQFELTEAGQKELDARAPKKTG